MSMPYASLVSRSRAAALLGVLGVLLAAQPGIGYARADLDPPDRAAKPSTRLGPGYAISLSVTVSGADEPELSGTFPLDAEGRLQLTADRKPVAPIPLTGLTAEEARGHIAAAIARYFRQRPLVRLVISRIPRFQVLVEGATMQTGPVTLVDGSRLSDLIPVVSTLPTADISHIGITRIASNGGRERLTADFGRFLAGEVIDRFADPALQNGDVVYFPTTAGPPPTVAVQGEVQHPGFYGYKRDMTVRDALDSAGGLLGSADPDRVTICRVSERRVIVVSGERANKNAPTDNLRLLPDDSLFVAPRDTGRRCSVVGAVPHPITFDYKVPITLTRAISDAGGFKPGADRKNVLLLRNMLIDPTKVQPLPIDYDKIARGEQPDITLQPGDMVQVQDRKRSGSGLVDLGLLLLRLFVF